MLKRGLTSYQIVTVIIQIIFLVIASFSVVYVVSSGINDELNVGSLRAASFNDRVYYSMVESELVTVKDISSDDLFAELTQSRSYPGVIDVSKLDGLNELYMFQGENKYLAAKITFMDFNGRVINETYYNSDKFFRWRPLVWTPFYDEYVFSYPVLVTGHNEIYNRVIKNIDSQLEKLKGPSQSVTLKILKNDDTLVKKLDLSKSGMQLLGFLNFDNPKHTGFDSLPVKKLKIGLYSDDGKEICKPSSYETNANSILTFDRYLTTCENSFSYHKCNVGSTEVLVTYCGMYDLHNLPFTSPMFNVYISDINQQIKLLEQAKSDFIQRSKANFDSVLMKIEVIVP